MADHDATAELPRLRARVEELERRDTRGALLGPILAAAPIILVRFDHLLRITYVSRYVQGLGPEGVLGRPLFDFIEPSSHEVTRTTIARVRATRQPGSFENSGPGPDGSLAHYHTNVLAIDDADGTVGGCLVATDVTTLKLRERAVAEGEEALHIALAATKLGLFSWDLTTSVVTWDARMREITGLSEPVDISQYIERLVHPDDRAQVAADGERSMNGAAFERAHRIVRPDGEVRWVLSVGGTGGNGGASGARPTRVVGGLLDITEQRRLEESLRESQRLNAVGTLTAGVAHNFNNLLTVILPSLELLRSVVPSSHASILADCAGAADRAADLVHKLMTYAGKRPPRAHRDCDVGQVVERALALCERAFENHIEISCTVAQGLGTVSADPADVDQVLMNLLLNARDAVSVRGCLVPRIEVRVERVTDAGADLVAIRVRDNGTGMDAETLRRACEPFFTTKEVGSGTGLGLATSSSIARSLGGRLELESQPGRGTTVTFTMPAAKGVSEAPRAVERASATPRMRVLLIDDDPLVRSATTRLLELRGHEVVCVEDGTAAVVAATRQRFDVLLVDRSLPGEPGTVLVPRLRPLAPGARFFFFTGHDLTREEAAIVDGVVSKPVRTQELLAAIGGK